MQPKFFGPIRNTDFKMGSNKQQDSGFSVPGFRINQQDAVEWLRLLPKESVDLFITDPPYESLEKHRAIGTTTRLKNSKSSSNKWFEIFPNSRFEELLIEVYRVLKKNSHFYLFCDQETAFAIKPIGQGKITNVFCSKKGHFATIDGS